MAGLGVRLAGVIFLVAGCASEADSPESDGSSGTGSTGVAAPTSTGIGTTSVDSTPSSSSGDSGVTTAVGSSSSSGGGVPGDPEGTPCVDGSTCDSGFCNGARDELLCTVCETDEDCPDAGCVALPEGGAICRKKNPQDPCTQDEACFSDMCPLALDTGDWAGELRGCSMCVEDEDCGDALCGIRINLSTPVASLDCVAVGSLPNDFWCRVGPSGDMACTSGHCAPVPFEGFELGVCGDCKTNTDCAVGTCMAGTIQPDSLNSFGSTCG